MCRHFRLCSGGVEGRESHVSRKEMEVDNIVYNKLDLFYMHLYLLLDCLLLNAHTNYCINFVINVVKRSSNFL